MENLPAKAGDADSIPGSGRSPGEGNGKMVTHSAILAWEIPETEEPGRLESMGSQRVGRHLATKQQQQIQTKHVLKK